MHSDNLEYVINKLESDKIILKEYYKKYPKTLIYIEIKNIISKIKYFKGKLKNDLEN